LTDDDVEHIKEAILENIIIGLSMSPLLGTCLPYGLQIRRTGHNQPPVRVGGWVLTAANAAGTNGLTCFPKHGGARDNKFLVTHPMTDQRSNYQLPLSHAGAH
jgi:hypothetical protein